MTQEEKRLARMQRFTQGGNDQASTLISRKGKRPLSTINEDAGDNNDIQDDDQNLVGKKAKLGNLDKNMDSRKEDSKSTDENDENE